MNPALVTATLLVALCVAVVVSTVRLVPTGSYALVLRWGRVARESGPGVVAVVPGVDRLVVLSDPKGALPPYDAVILVSPRRAGDERLLAALRPLVGSISVEAMRAANYSVDRDRDKLTPAQAARSLEPGK